MLSGRYFYAAILALSLFCFAACSSETSPLGADSADSLPSEATGFITPDTPKPAIAIVKAGDVPRDEYGRPFTYALLGERLPDFSAPLLSGGALTNADLMDQWSVIDVWGLWCGDCLKDAPNVSALNAALETNPDVQFLSLHTPPNKDRADEAFGRWGSVEAYFDEKGYNYPVAVDSDASIRSAWQIAWTPSFLLIGPDGSVQGFRTELSAAGETAVDDFIADIETVRQAWQSDSN